MAKVQALGALTVGNKDDAAFRLLMAGSGTLDVNRSGAWHGWTPLMIAARAGKVDAVKMLLEKGAYPSIRRADGGCALHAAARGWHFTIVELLLEAGADVDCPDRTNSTPCNLAVRADYLNDQNNWSVHAISRNTWATKRNKYQTANGTARLITLLITLH